MAATVTTKRGRKPRPYVTATGDPIPGLSRRPSDGRWRIVATGYTFTEANEAAALKRFYDLERERLGKKDRALIPFTTQQDGGDAMRLMVKAATKKPVFVGRIPLGTQQVRVQQEIDTPEMWAYVTDIILNRPAYAVKRTGIQSLAWLPDLERPTDSLKLSDAAKVYADFAKVSKDEHARIRRAWDEFRDIVEVGTVRDITHEVIETYEKALAKMGLAPKTLKHRIGAVRTVLAFALKRGKSVKDCRAALDAMAMLAVDDANPLDPRPIGVDTFWGIYRAAIKAGDRPFAAMLLLSLNAAMYSSEVAVLKWADIDLTRGELATRRRKTSVPRVAVIWPETVAALKALPRDEHSDRLFHAARGPLYRQAIGRLWTEYRKAAGIPDGVVYSQLRDAAFTIAARVDIDAARLLNGHKLAGAADAYVLRQPQAVREVCEAIRYEFGVAKHVTKD